MSSGKYRVITAICCFILSAELMARDHRHPPGHGHGHPPKARAHTQTQSSGVSRLVPATEVPTPSSQISIRIEGDLRVIEANGMPDHATGAFPNRGNPHEITQQAYRYRVPAQPQLAAKVTPLGMGNFGIAVNGVPFDPGAAEWFQGKRGSAWQYEALSGAVPLGIDVSHAHVQPTGAYHYHGLPKLLLSDLDVNKRKHSPLIGWAADGFPIYALYGFKQSDNAGSEIVQLRSGYQLKSGQRPQGNGNPGGRYDGTFLADYEYIAGTGDLDECNGRFAVTPDFPQGGYAYFLTETWPVIPRCYKGTPSRDFERKRGSGRRR